MRPTCTARNPATDNLPHPWSAVESDLSPTAADQAFPATATGGRVLDHERRPPGSSSVLEIANAIVRLYKDTFGRGPTRSRAMFSGPDTLVVLLEDTLTVAERQLVSLGESARVREQRQVLNHALESAKRSEVQRILRRRVLSCVGGTDPGHDLAVEVFLLESDYPTGHSVEPRGE